MFAALPQQVHIIEEAPEVALKGGLYYVTDRLETGQVIIRIFRPNTFFRTFAKFGEVARSCRLAGAAEIIEFSDEKAKRA